MIKTKFLLSFFLLFLFSFRIYSQSNIVQKTDTVGFYKLNDVVVTATKNKTNTIELANSISVIDSTRIADGNSNNVFDVLKNETGVSFTSQGTAGTLSNIYIRGANASHTLVLIDGVEVNLPNDPSSVYDFSALPVDNIERIEILRGPQSTLYGSDALAGVINIITKQGYGIPKFSLLTEGGTYNTYKALLGLNGSINKFNYSLTLSRTGSDGFSNASEKYGNTEKDGYTFNNFSSVVGYHLSNVSELNIYTRFAKSKSDYDQFGGKFGDDPTYVFNQEEFSIRAESKVKLFDDKWNQKIGLTFFRNVRKYSYDTSAASVYYSHSLYDGRKYKIDWQNDFNLFKNNLLTTGFEFESEVASSEYYAYNYLLLPDYASVFPTKEDHTLGIYLQDKFNLDKTLFATAGIRLDNHNQFGVQTTYRIAPAFMVWETNTKLKATLGTGFKSPSLFYLYDPIYGNEKLSPEKSLGFDLGIEQYFFRDGISFGVTYFYNRFTDMFGFDYITFKTININKAVTKGAEIYLEVKPLNQWNLKVNYTYTNAKDMSPNSSDYGKRLLRRPENKIGFYGSYNFSSKTNFNTEIIWVGNREDINFSDYQRVNLKSYVLINIAAHYDPVKFLRLNFRIENLLNSDYEEVYGYGTAGLSFYGGIKLVI